MGAWLYLSYGCLRIFELIGCDDHLDKKISRAAIFSCHHRSPLFLRITKLRRILKKICIDSVLKKICIDSWFACFMKAESEFYKEVSGVGVGRQIGDLGFLRKATKVLLCTSASVHIFHFQESS